MGRHVYQIGGDPARITALKQRTIDAASLSFPGYGIAMKMGFPIAVYEK